MCLKMVSWLRFGSKHIVILEAPGRSARAATPMNEVADTIRLALPESASIAAFALLMPGIGIEAGIPVQGRDEGISTSTAPFRVIRAARNMQRDQAQAALIKSTHQRSRCRGPSMLGL